MLVTSLKTAVHRDPEAALSGQMSPFIRRGCPRGRPQAELSSEELNVLHLRSSSLPVASVRLQRSVLSSRKRCRGKEGRRRDAGDRRLAGNVVIRSALTTFPRLS